MSSFVLVWLGASMIVLAGVYLLRSLRAQHVARLRELRWRSLLVLALAVGLVPALAVDLLAGRSVELPDELSQRPELWRPAER